MRQRLKIHPSTWLALAAGVLLGRGELVLLLSLSLALHELGHLMALEAANLAAGEIRVYPFGAEIEVVALGRAEARVERLVALAGPLQSLAVASLFGLVARLFPAGTHLSLAAEVNLGLGLVNLLPAYPLDGGRVLRSLWERRLGRREATRRALSLTRGVATLAALLGGASVLLGSFSVTPFLLAAALFVAAGAEEREQGFLVPRGMVLRRRILREEGTMPVERLAARASLRLSELIRRLSPERWHEVVLLEDDMRAEGVLDEEDIAQAFEAGRLEEEIRSLGRRRP